VTIAGHNELTYLTVKSLDTIETFSFGSSSYVRSIRAPHWLSFVEQLVAVESDGHHSRDTSQWDEDQQPLNHSQHITNNNIMNDITMQQWKSDVLQLFS